MFTIIKYTILIVIVIKKQKHSKYISSKIRSGQKATDQHSFNHVRKEGRKEGNVLFNDALNTFYLRLYGVRHMVKDHSDRERKPTAATWATLSD